VFNVGILHYAGGCSYHGVVEVTLVIVFVGVSEILVVRGIIYCWFILDRLRVSPRWRVTFLSAATEK